MFQTIEEMILLKEDLEKKIKETFEIAKKEAMDEAKAIIARHDLTAADLGLQATRKKYAVKPAVVKFRNGELNWTGRGRMPNWLKDAISAGHSLDSFRV